MVVTFWHVYMYAMITHNINSLQLAKDRAVASANEVLCLPLQTATHNCKHKTRGGRKKNNETKTNKKVQEHK